MAAKGRRVEAAINARARPGALTEFMQAAVYAPAPGLLFEVFATDNHLPSLPVAVDGSAMPRSWPSLTASACGRR